MNEIEEARTPSTPASIGTKNRVVSEVSKSESKSIGVRFARDYTQYPHFNQKSGCIIPDLCRERQIEHCPFRTGWTQEINESDQDFQSFCISHPAEA